MATETTTVTDIADAAERQRRLELKELLNKKYKWIDLEVGPGLLDHRGFCGGRCC